MTTKYFDLLPIEGYRYMVSVNYDETETGERSCYFVALMEPEPGEIYYFCLDDYADPDTFTDAMILSFWLNNEADDKGFSTGTYTIDEMYDYINENGTHEDSELFLEFCECYQVGWDE